MGSAFAPSCDVLVIGSDIAALLAGIDCARIGLTVHAWVMDEPGAPTEFTNTGGVVADALTGLHVPFEVLTPAPGEEVVAGIPSNPFSPAVREALGWRGAWKIYFDRVKPVLSIGVETNLGTLVRTRLGVEALNKLVDPNLLSRYGRRADDLAVDQVAFGLGQAMTRGGSLTTGVLELVAADARVAQTLTLPGGSASAMEAAIAQLEYFAATVHRVSAVELSLVADQRGGQLISATGSAGDEKVSSLATALLCDPSLVELPEGIEINQVGFVGTTDECPGLETALPASREVSTGIRRALLSDPAKPPIGPTSFEG